MYNGGLKSKGYKEFVKSVEKNWDFDTCSFKWLYRFENRLEVFENGDEFKKEDEETSKELFEIWRQTF